MKHQLTKHQLIKKNCCTGHVLLFNDANSRGILESIPWIGKLSQLLSNNIPPLSFLFSLPTSHPIRCQSPTQLNTNSSNFSPSKDSRNKTKELIFFIICFVFFACELRMLACVRYFLLYLQQWRRWETNEPWHWQRRPAIDFPPVGNPRRAAPSPHFEIA